MSQNISETIRLIRESKGYSQEYMASQLNITQQAYSRLEKQPETITLQRFRDLSKILNVPILTLLGEENMYFMQNINQQGGNAATKLVLQNQTASSEHSELIRSMQNEIDFLRNLVLKLQV